MAADTRGWETAFWAAFATSANSMIVVDDDRCIVDANDAATELLGQPRDELLGTSVLTFLPPGATPDESAREELLSAGYQTGHTEIVRADGKVVACEYAATRTDVPGHGSLTLYVTIESRIADPETPDSDGDSTTEPLTRRETQIVHLVALGKTGTMIADELHVSPETVRTHVRNAMSKTGTHTRAALVATAFAQKLI